MDALATALPYFVALFALATAVVLFMGVVSMGIKEPVHKTYSNKLMRWRVGLQGMTLILLALYVLVT